jgi:hypothetical protein
MVVARTMNNAAAPNASSIRCFTRIRPVSVILPAPDHPADEAGASLAQPFPPDNNLLPVVRATGERFVVVRGINSRRFRSPEGKT